MLIDNVTIKVKAGKGGGGKVAFNSNLMSLGPVGGDGGKGGDIYAEGVSDLSALAQFRNIKSVKAGDGGNGSGQSVDGPGGKNTIIKLPIGTVITDLDNGETTEVIKIGEQTLIARGGKGGRGNFQFRSPTNTSPKDFEYGKAGEEFTVKLELKLIADVGLIGLPNVGKSSLLNELTRAKSKVANYPFTTLEPNLGVYYELVLADIPGIIEGASAGKGLGVKFLQHIERTKILFHLISAESADPLEDYQVVRKELGAYNSKLIEKDEYVFLSKSDMISVEELQTKLSALKAIGKPVMPISVIDETTLTELKSILNKIKEVK